MAFRCRRGHTVSLVIVESSHESVGRSRMRMTWDYMVRCYHCDQVALTVHPTLDRVIVCLACEHNYPAGTFAGNLARTICDQCGLAAKLRQCGAARICNRCAYKWEKDGGKVIVEPRFHAYRDFDVSDLADIDPIPKETI